MIPTAGCQGATVKIYTAASSGKWKQRQFMIRKEKTLLGMAQSTFTTQALIGYKYATDMQQRHSLGTHRS